VQNPFEVPVTLYQVQTHIPIELMDVNRERLELLRNIENGDTQETPLGRVAQRIALRRRVREAQNGIATAVGTEIAPGEAAALFTTTVSVGNFDGGSVTGVALNFPDNPTSEELDAILRRFADFERGVVPVTLQPGDSVVRQFVLRTRDWLLFTPLAHTFQIQMTYALDGVDHTATLAYEAQIQARTSAITIGGLLGALVGTLLKVLTTSGDSFSSGMTALAVAALATVAVVIAFARKSIAQPLVSVEDFWGGAVIGFSVGFFGFQSFTKLLPGAT
jgi:cation transport regulator ChaC